MKTIQEIITIKKVSPNKANLCFNGKLVREINHGSKPYYHENNALKLLRIDTPYELCKLLDATFSEVENVINNPAYIHFHRPKKKGGYREIYAPSNELKRIQKRLNYYLQAYYLCIKPKEVHGFVINPHYLGTHCNIAANAKIHVGRESVLNIDLKDFFPSIRAKQVKELLLSDIFNFDEQITNAITLLTTLNGRLPIGAPTSPVISNFICRVLDEDLIEFSKDHGFAYTRYADDLTFSSSRKISHDELLDIINIITKNNFSINQKKLRIQSKNRKQTVTGLTVNDRVNVDRILLKKVRAMIHDLSLNGLDEAVKKHYKSHILTDEMRVTFLNRLRGYVNFIGQIRGKDDTLYLIFKNKFEKSNCIYSIGN
ncbi:MAG: reverse transcriptase family protein [Bacteroidales bacterium]